MEAVLRIYGVVVVPGHGFKGLTGASEPGSEAEERGPVRFRPDAKMDEADRDSHVDESVSPHCTLQARPGHATNGILWPRPRRKEASQEAHD